MAKDSGGGEKTEKASPRKLRKAREEGQVGRSIEVPSVCVILAGTAILYLCGHYMYENLAAVMRGSFSFDTVPHFGSEYCIRKLYQSMRQLALILLPLLGVVFLAAFAGNVLQVGFSISWKALQPKFSRLNPIQGASRFLSTQVVVDLFKNVFKVLVIGLTAFWVIKKQMLPVLGLYDHGVAFILLYILKVAFRLTMQAGVIMAVLAFLDLIYQKWKFAEDQKMTKQEVKEEHKQTEGDPQVKARIRQLQAQAAKKRMMQDVPKADVVITNPTHLALAIQYDALTMKAPRVIAKGAGRVAGRIREIAANEGIPVVENKPLARNLYKTVDIGDDVPPELYVAVAEVLAYVYKLKNRRH